MEPQLINIGEAPNDRTGDPARVWAGKHNANITGLNNDKLDVSQKGAPSGVAELDESGKVPSSQLPAYVDDILEFADAASLPAVGEAGKIYVTLDDNHIYRWSGSAYIQVSSPLVLGTSQSNAHRGDHGTAAYNHSQETGTNPHGVTPGGIGALAPTDLSTILGLAALVANNPWVDNSKNANEDLTKGDPIQYYNGGWRKAQAGAEATINGLVRICGASVTAGNPVVAVDELILDGLTSITPGATYYVGVTGGYTATAPTGDNWILPIGKGQSTSAIKINVSNVAVQPGTGIYLQAVDVETYAKLIAICPELDAQISARIASTEKGAANGVAPLGGDSKLSTTYLPDAILGALNYQGTWDADTNDPTIPAASSSNKGHYYIVQVAGTTDVDGISDWEVGDWVVSNGSAWGKVDNSDKFTVAEKNKLAAIEDSATADQTAIEIASLYASLIPQVSTGEIIAGTESALRTFSPENIVSMIGLRIPFGSTQIDRLIAAVTPLVTSQSSDYAVPFNTSHNVELTLTAASNVTFTDPGFNTGLFLNIIIGTGPGVISSLPTIEWLDGTGPTAPTGVGDQLQIWLQRTASGTYTGSFLIIGA